MNREDPASGKPYLHADTDGAATNATKAVPARLRARRGGMIVVGVLGFLAAAPASYGAAPSASLTVSQSVDAGQTAAFTWRATRRPAGSKVVLQRAMGQGRVFQTVRVLRSSQGAGKLPPYAIGRYTFRVAVVNNRRRTIARSAGRTLKVYGQVPLEKLCGSLKRLSGEDCGTTGTTQASGRVFTYAAELYAPSDGTAAAQLSAVTTTCRDITLFFSLLQNDHQTVNVSIVQQSLDAQTSAVTDPELGTLTAKLDGGPWQLNTQQVAGPHFAGSIDVFVNGSATCYTPSGA